MLYNCFWVGTLQIIVHFCIPKKDLATLTRVSIPLIPFHPSICLDECEREGGRGWGYTGAQFSNEIYTQSKQNSVIRGPPPINLDRVPALAEGYSPLSHGSIQASDRPVIRDKWPVNQSQVVCHLGHAWLKVVVLPKTNMFFGMRKMLSISFTEGISNSNLLEHLLLHVPFTGHRSAWCFELTS